MWQALGVVLLSLAVIVLSIFLLELGSLLKGRCVLRRCGHEGSRRDARPRARCTDRAAVLDVRDPEPLGRDRGAGRAWLSAVVNGPLWARVFARVMVGK